MKTIVKTSFGLLGSHMHHASHAMRNKYYVMSRRTPLTRKTPNILDHHASKVPQLQLQKYHNYHPGAQSQRLSLKSRHAHSLTSPNPITLITHTHVTTDSGLASWLVTSCRRYCSRSFQLGNLASAATRCRCFTSDRCITLHGTAHRCDFCPAVHMCCGRGEYVGSREAST